MYFYAEIVRLRASEVSPSEKNQDYLNRINMLPESLQFATVTPLSQRTIDFDEVAADEADSVPLFFRSACSAARARC